MEEESHWHGGGDAWSPSETELRLARSARHWKRAWGVGFLAAPLLLAAFPVDQMGWLALAGVLLWVASLGYLLLQGQFAE